MTLTQANKPETTGSSSNTQNLTVQAHHLKAAEHLEMASKSHKDAARMIDSGDHKAAIGQSKAGAEHIENAAKHASEAVKKTQAVASKSGAHA